jgi:sugar/nucleoside kinase (ribokinase family)
LARFDVTFVGEINLDLVLYGLPGRLPTERELLADDALLTLGSSSAICAHNLAMMGARVGFVTCVGDDPLGDLALKRLRAAGVDLKSVVRAKGSMTGITVVLPHAHRRHIFTYPGTMFGMTFKDLDLEYLRSAQHFHMSSFFLHRGLYPRISDLFRRMKKAGLSTSLDTNDDPNDEWNGALGETLKHVDVFLPNEREACKIAGTEDSEEALRILAPRGPIVVVKLGPRGAAAIHKKKRVRSRPPEVAAIDPIGAGDSFDAGFLYQFVRGASLEKCLLWANLAGAFSTTQRGGTEAFRDPRRWRRFLREHDAR